MTTYLYIVYFIPDVLNDDMFTNDMTNISRLNVLIHTC